MQSLISSKVNILVEFASPVESSLLKTIPGVLEVLYPASGSQQSAVSNRQSASAIWRLKSDPATDIRSDVFKFAVNNQLTVLSMVREEQKLEEVFQELTKN